ncbi:hypothetical protein [Breznakiella homolactica]|uniref:Flagellar hook protein FlgE/F/G-like D1 domain-containing protein n=1 Tax=Breznakiella homolactica TaxID=2798577 RepID=A0A7T7XPX4_9SPIR|nr:hypothetical protein [Breznakiella homolactica]QQO10351.1 hypothetical protein JFL75_05380 [Breznakiella homolactica]
MNIKINSILLILIFCSKIFADDLNILEEYKLLYTDLSHFNEYGYKSFYNDKSNNALPNINFSQGMLKRTDNHYDCAIFGDGFFKIRLNNGLVGYTRSGEFKINSDGEIKTKQGYSLYDPIFADEYFSYIEIHNNHEVYEVLYTGEKKIIGELLTYIVPYNLLEHYEDAIYVLKDNQTVKDELIIENMLYNQFLECSNYNMLSVLLRMYYLLSIPNNNLIQNKDFKKELVRLQIAKISNQNLVLDRSILNLNANIKEIMVLMKNIEIPEMKERNVEDNEIVDLLMMEIKIREIKNMIRQIEEGSITQYDQYFDANNNYLEAILPFIKWDY